MINRKTFLYIPLNPWKFRVLMEINYGQWEMHWHFCKKCNQKNTYGFNTCVFNTFYENYDKLYFQFESIEFKNSRS